MNVVVDYGNTMAKVGIFDHQTLMEKHAFNNETALAAFLANLNFESIIVSSVNIAPAKILARIPDHVKKFALDQSLPVPIINLYKTPETLGVDRLAAVCGAHQIFPFQNSLVIDAGTCVTYDFIDKEGRYHGGGISPGLSMRYRAVHTFTARLPLITPAAEPKLVGNSTETCIQSGVTNGLLAELEGIIARYEVEFESIRVILCGGDTGFFENKLKASIFASPELVLVGLNSILIYNVSR